MGVLQVETKQNSVLESVDGVQRQPRTGIKVVVVGGGIGGLYMALESWRQGHDVCVVERSKDVSALGDTIAITPSALCTLQYYPNMQKEYNSTAYNPIIRWFSMQGDLLYQTDPEWIRPGKVHPAKGTNVSFIKNRAGFIQMLSNQVARLGIPVFWGRKAVSYAENSDVGQAYVETDSGEIFSGDVVVAADGIGTKSHAAVTGQDIEATSSGYAVVRAGFHTSDLAPGSKAWSLIPKEGEREQFRMYMAEGNHLVVTLTRGFIAFGYTHIDDGNAKESWHHNIEPEEVVEMLQSVEGWDEAVIDLVRQCPRGRPVDWPLKWRNPQPHWTSQQGRIVQLGDSAHSFLPTSGNGATQAIEDALSLAECLRAGGKDKVHLSTQVHQKLRYQRTAVVQRTGFVNRGMLHRTSHLENLPYEQRAEILEPAIRHGKWMWGHRANQYAADNYDAALANLQFDIPFVNTNLPQGHVYEEWTMESEKAREATGLPSTLKLNGDWSS